MRIYLTSSQEVFQQDDSCTGAVCEVMFEQRRNHRTQLIITTNDIDNSGAVDKLTLDAAKAKFATANAKVWGQDGADVSDGALTLASGQAAALENFAADNDNELQLPLGPLPYIYKTYSTVGGNVPTQQSPVTSIDGVGDVLMSVCPVCTHPAYCVLYDGTDHRPNTGEDTLVNIPAQPCETATNSETGGCATANGVGVREANTAAELQAAGFTQQLTGFERIIEGSTVPSAEMTAADGDQYPAGTPSFFGCWQVKISYAPVMDMCAEDPDVVVSDLNPLKGRCSKVQSTFTVYNGLLPRQAGGTHPEAAGWSYESPVPMVHTVPGNSDFRIDEIGDQVLRTRSDPRPLCRYSNCPELTVNGGDQQPESKNFLYPDWQSGASWRGDLSSSAQLVFDSTNWQTPQFVQVVARADDVYEPEVNNRGQDAYVHHFVVAQDINLEHTYYDDIEVNDLTVSITDDDPAVVIENANEVNPAEGGANAEVKLRLASEPMYPVTVYLQSGPFFEPGEEPTCTTTDGETECNFLPDDEQVIFQDQAQFNTCWSMESTVRTFTYPLVRDQPTSYRAEAAHMDHGGTFNYQGCFEDANGAYTLVNAPVDERMVSFTTRQIPATMQCHGDDRCVYKELNLPNGAYPRDNFYEGRNALVPDTQSCTIVDCSEVDAVYDPIGHYVESGQIAGTRDDVGTEGSSTSPVDGVLVDADGADGTASDLASDPACSGSDCADGATTVAQRTCKRDGNFLSLRTYSSAADAKSHLPTTGYTCNSYVTFSTTNWDTWQTLDVIGVNDDTDEGEFRISEIGYLYESIDWYYNSAGSKLLTEVSTQYKPTEDGLLAGTQDARDTNVSPTPSPVKLSMFDTRFGKHINRYPRLGNTDVDDSAAGLHISTADQMATLDDATISAAWSSSDTDTDADKGWENAVGSENAYAQANGGKLFEPDGSVATVLRGAGYYSPATWGAPCHGNSQCTRAAAFHGYDARNEVCCCEDVGTATAEEWVLETTDTKVAGTPGSCADSNGVTTGASNSDECQTQHVGTTASNVWTTSGSTQTYQAFFGAGGTTRDGSAEDPLQVQTFQPQEYANRNVQCGAQVMVSDNNVNHVTISRSDCEATEGRRFWFDVFQQEPTPMECTTTGALYSLSSTGAKERPMEVTLGLFTATRSASGEYEQPSYSRSPSTGDSIPSFGSIEGEYHSYCRHTGTCTNTAATCGGAAIDCDATPNLCLDGAPDRYLCETKDLPAGNIFMPADLQVGDTCYDTGKTEDECNAVGGAFFAADNGVTVDNGLTTDDNGSSGVCSNSIDTTEAECVDAGASWTTAENAFSEISCPSKDADGWTMTDVPDSRYRGMTAPVCPYTIVLDAAPKEGATVVVSLREDAEESNLRDHELYFYEEASYRPGVTAAECTEILYPGSSWVNGGCFIHNVPLDANDMPVPRGNVDLDVMFTDDDWNVPRRITAIALNDDVDEPTEVRTIYHTVGTCTGYNHNTDEVCVEDEDYTGIAVDSIDVTVVDDDIADLVVIGDDGYVCADGQTGDNGICARAEANIIDESFIGSYDAAGPRLDLTVNFWYQRFERQGPYAEDGISGSSFQGRSQDHNNIVGTSWPLIDPGNDGSTVFSGRGAQIKNDGIGAGGFLLESGIDGICTDANGDPVTGGRNTLGTAVTGATASVSKAVCLELDPTNVWVAGNLIESTTQASITGGYITDNEDPLCLNPDPMLQDDRCFRIDNIPWVAYDPYWDIYVADTADYASYDDAQPGHVYDDCTPTGSNDGDADRDVTWATQCSPGTHANSAVNTQPNRGFKGIGPAYTEPEDEFAITVHSRECRGDMLGDGTAGHGDQTKGADFYRQDEASSAELAGYASDDGPCVYGTFQVRLNSSPGTKHVRRRYVGEAETVLEEELVQIVVTPDVTPQTMFDPPSVTFTHTGEGDTNRWDEPFRFKVVPVDDEVDERAGVVIDFTSFTITQSHFGDDYWTYTTPYQTLSADSSVMKLLSPTATAAAGRVDDHTPFRHHIRTIHTFDNDYAGVTIESGVASGGAVAQTACDSNAGCTTAAPATPSGLDEASASVTNRNYETRAPVALEVTEGETFSFYTLRLASQPRKVQRQAGTNPNNPIMMDTLPAGRDDFDHTHPGGRVVLTDYGLYSGIGGSCDDSTSVSVEECSAAGGSWTFADGADMAGIYHHKHTGMAKAATSDPSKDGTYPSSLETVATADRSSTSPSSDCDLEDFSDVTRPSQCGSVEGEQNYWVDVTVTQSIHLDLAEPSSCPVSPKWGGGSSPVTAEHPRFPFNAKLRSGTPQPINELVETAADLDAYLPTCGGWQRDATYRFTADNWNVPQYVYLYAHNDKDAATVTSGHVDEGGNEDPSGSPTTTVIKHYVETEDTLDNMDTTDDPTTEIMEGYVQRNKHGGQYTSGNKERYPFGQLSDGAGTEGAGSANDQSTDQTSDQATAHTADTGTTSTNQPIQGVDGMQQPILTEPFGNRETGFSTYGYSDYQWLYGYYEQEHTWTGVHYASTACGAVHMGAGIGHVSGTCTEDASITAKATCLAAGHTWVIDGDDGTNVGSAYTWSYPTTDESDADLYDVALPIATRTTDEGPAATIWPTGYSNIVAGESCEDPFDNLRPYTQSGDHCVPVSQYVGADAAGCPRSSLGVTCGTAHTEMDATPEAPHEDGTQLDATFVRAEEVTASPGPNYAGVGPVVGPGVGAPTAATPSNGAALSWTTTNAASGVETQYCVPKYATKNGGMAFPPLDVQVTVTDNDAIAIQGEIDPAECRQTSLFSSTGSNEWLVDKNCRAGDAGGLPGYPITSVLAFDADEFGHIEAHAGSNGDAGYAGRRLLMAEQGHILGDAMIPGDGQCANGRIGAYCTECPEGMNVTADGCA